MLPSYVYLLVLAAGSLAVLLLLPFPRGRAVLRAGVPATLFFLALGGVAEGAYRLGRAHGTRDAAGTPADRAETYTCSMHPQVRQSQPGQCPICHMELTLLQDAGGDFVIDPVVVQNMGVRLHRVTRGVLQRTVRAFAALQEAQSRQRDVSLKVGGFVEELQADTEGMAIRAGDPLFSLYSPDLVVAQEELIAARKSGDPDLLAAARQKLLLWDVPPATVDDLQAREHAQRLLTWTSPADGVLTQRNVVAGAPAAQGSVLLRIVDLSVLWLDAQVPEADFVAVRLGQPVTASLQALPGFELQGQVVFLAPQLDPRTRTGTVRIEVDNRDGRLRPGMYARVKFVHTLAEDAVRVPAEAVLDTGVRQLAWIAVGRGKFEARTVQLGASGDDGLVEVRTGLQVDDQVVVSGQFLIDAESRLREGTRKMGGEGLMPGGDMLPPETLDVSAATQGEVDALFAAYLAVADAFTHDRYDGANWQAMRASATTLAAAPEASLQLAAGALAGVLERAHGDIKQQRVEFKQVSASLLTLLERVPPSGKPGAQVYVHHCPMVEADWLQLDEDTRNPYDTSMLSCGTVRRALPVHVASSGGEGR
ncbi:MAG: efflux RND transporter periplasmic adaptor subunit [Planctomycetota bacterium]